MNTQKSAEKKEGEIDFTQLFLKTIQNENELVKNYKEIMGVISSKKYYSKYQKKFVDLVKVVIKDKKIESKQKFLALLLLKHGLETKEIFLIDYVRIKVLARLKKYAEFSSGKKSEQLKINPETKEVIEDKRGRLLFGKIVDKDYSQQFYLLNLECLQNWASRYYKIYKLKEYKTVYESIVKKNVFISQEAFYFNDYTLHDPQEVYKWQTSLDFIDHIKYLLFSIQSLDHKRDNYDPAQTLETQQNQLFDTNNNTAMFDNLNDTMLNQSSILKHTECTNQEVVVNEYNEDNDNYVSINDPEIEILTSLKMNQKQHNLVQNQLNRQSSLQQEQLEVQLSHNQAQQKQLEQEQKEQQMQYQLQLQQMKELEEEVQKKRQLHKDNLKQMYEQQQELNKQKTTLGEQSEQMKVYQGQLEHNTQLLLQQQQVIVSQVEELDNQQKQFRQHLQHIYHQQINQMNAFQLAYDRQVDCLHHRFHLLQQQHQRLRHALSHLATHIHKQQSVHIYKDDQGDDIYKAQYERQKLEIDGYKTSIKSLENQLRLQRDIHVIQKGQLNRMTQSTINSQINPGMSQDQKVVDQLWETIDSKNREIEKLKVMVNKLSQKNQEESKLIDIEQEFTDIYAKLKTLQDSTNNT